MEGTSFEDSVMVISDQSDTSLCRLSTQESIAGSSSVVTTPRTMSEASDSVSSQPQSSSWQVMVPFSPRDEVTTTVLSTAKENETVTSPPFTSGETVASPHPGSGETVPSLPPDSGETVTSLPPGSGETVTSPPLTSGETVASPPPGSGETAGSQPFSSMMRPPPSTSPYHRVWSWDDSVPVTTTPSSLPFRRAVTCRNRPPPDSQQQQQQFDVAILRRGGSSFHSALLRHPSQNGPLPPSE